MPKSKVKLLGVILDKKFTFKDHVVEKAVYKGTVAALALKRLKGLRPVAARQLFHSTVTSVSDYASSVWSLSISDKIRKLFDRIQRIGAQAILGIFKSVALPIAEAEASLMPEKLRHQHQLARFWTNCLTLPSNHPMRKTQQRLKVTRRFCSPLARGVKELNLDPKLLKDMEEIQAYCLPPEYPRVKVEIIEDSEKAIHRAQNIRGIKVAVDSSGRNNLIGVGISYGPELNHQLTLGSTEQLSVHFGEMYAIKWAVETLARVMESGFSQPTQVTVLSDSQAALRALKAPACQSGQWVLRQITHSIHELEKSRGHTIMLQWIPGHANVVENERADLAARAATEVGKSSEIELPLLRSIELQKVLVNIKERNPKLTAKTGKFTQSLDQALPGKHVRKLYDRLSRRQAATLSQLRTGKNRLHYYLAKARIVESGMCECKRESETVSHFVLRCPRWTAQRAEMLKTVRKHAGNLSFLLGGWDPWACPDRGKWQPNLAAVGAVIQFVSNTGRFEEEASEKS